MSNGSSIDDKIVSIKFDNQAFEQNITNTMASLDQLSKKIATVGAGKGFSDINAAANSVDLSNVGKAVDNISSKFSTLGAVAFSTIQQLTQNLLGFAGRFAQQDILGPIITGGKQRAIDLQNANFEFTGVGLNATQVMADANAAVLGTAYSLADAAKAAGQLGAAGISAGANMQAALGGIAGAAAIVNDSFSDMSVLFTQSAASGKVTNEDLLQFSTRGLNAAAGIAPVLGKTQEQVHQMATDGTLDFNTFANAMNIAFGAHATTANQTYTGSLDNLHAALARLGASFDVQKIDQQRDLYNSLSPALKNVQAAIQPLVFTLLSARYQANQGLIGIINSLDFNNITFGIQAFSEGLKNIFGFLQGIGIIAKDAFKDIFPGQFSITLVLIADKFQELTYYLSQGLPVVQKIREIFDGLFALLDIGWGIIKGVATVIGDLLHALIPAGSGLFNFAATTGTLLTKLDAFLIKGGKLQDFFNKLGEILAIPIKLIAELSGKIVTFFSMGVSSIISDTLGQIKGRLSDASTEATNVQSVWDKLENTFKGILTVLDTIWDGISQWFHQLFQKIAAEMQPADFNSALDAVNVGLLGGITLMLKKFFEGGVKFGFGGGVFNNIKNTLNNVTRSLSLMQTNLKADALMKIAEAIGILAAALVVLSLINSQDLTKALAAMVVGFGELAAMMLVLDKSLLNPTAALKLSLVSGALIGTAAALVLLSLAIKEMSKLSWTELAKGLVGVGGGLAILVTGVNFISKDTGGLIRAGISMGIIAVALRILADDVKAFSGFSWTDMAKGMVGVASGLAAIVASMNLMPEGGVLQGLGFIAIAVGLRILANDVKAFGSMDMHTLVKGLYGLIVALAAVAVSMDLMDGGVVGAAAMVVVAMALEVVVNVVRKLGNMAFDQLLKGLGAMAITLGILVIAMDAMEGGVAGAFALIVVAGALEIFTDVLQKLGKMSIGQIVTGLVTIAAAMVILALASDALIESIPAMLGIGAALVLIGTGFTLLGLGAFLAVSALELFAKIGVGAIEKIAKAMPGLAMAGADFIINFANDLLKGAPVLLKTIRAVLDQLFLTIIKETPKLALALEAIITNALLLIQKDFPLLVQTGFLVISALLQGVQQNIGPITDTVTQIFANFSAAVVNDLPSIVASAANIIVTFLTELGNHEADIIKAAINLIAQLVVGIVEGQTAILNAVAGLIAGFITALGGDVLEIVAAGVQLVENLITGIASDAASLVTAVGNLIITFTTALANEALTIITAGVNLVITFVQGISTQALTLANAAGQCILNFINGLTAAVNTYEPQIISATIQLGWAIVSGVFKGIVNAPAIFGIASWFVGLGSTILGWVAGIADTTWHVGEQIVHGIWNGISGMAGWLYDKLSGWVDKTIGFFKSLWNILSPSKRMADEVGKYIPMGLMVGIASQTDNVKAGISDFTDMMVNAFQPDPKSIGDSWAMALNSLAGMDEFNPTITPVLDLTKIQDGANDIAGFLSVSAITPDVSTQKATAVSTNIQAALDSATAAATTPADTGGVTFNQTINAPTALSTNDIYRNTKSQITLAKEELAIS